MERVKAATPSPLSVAVLFERALVSSRRGEAAPWLAGLHNHAGLEARTYRGAFQAGFAMGQALHERVTIEFSDGLTSAGLLALAMLELPHLVVLRCESAACSILAHTGDWPAIVLSRCAALEVETLGLSLRIAPGEGVYLPRAAGTRIASHGGAFDVLRLDFHSLAAIFMELQIAGDGTHHRDGLALAAPQRLPALIGRTSLIDLVDLELQLAATCDRHEPLVRVLSVESMLYRTLAVAFASSEVQALDPILPVQRQCVSPADPSEQRHFAALCSELMSRLDDELGLPEIEALSGLSSRVLQNRFRRYAGCSPIQWVIRQKLLAARRDLELAGSADTVTTVAARYFGHLSEFSRRYRETFGERPSDTLRRARNRTAPSDLRRAREIS